MNDHGIPQFVRFNMANLADVRSSFQASRKAFSQWLGVSKHTVAQIEGGTMTISRGEYNRIASQLEWEVWR